VEVHVDGVHPTGLEQAPSQHGRRPITHSLVDGREPLVPHAGEVPVGLEAHHARARARLLDDGDWLTHSSGDGSGHLSPRTDPTPSPHRVPHWLRGLCHGDFRDRYSLEAIRVGSVAPVGAVARWCAARCGGSTTGPPLTCGAGQILTRTDLVVD